MHLHFTVFICTQIADSAIASMGAVIGTQTKMTSGQVVMFAEVAKGGISKLSVNSNEETKVSLVACACQFITCSAGILYADWSIGVRPGVVHTL